MTIQIKEMAPRDGLQNESKILTPSQIVTFIQLLQEAGLSYIEVGAFVHPKSIPAMARTQEVLAQLSLNPHTQTSVLVPNEVGMHKAIEAGCKEVAIFTAASETFNQKNIQASIEESFTRFVPVMKLAQANNIRVRGYISTAFVCPFEGDISVHQVIPVMHRLLDMGCYEVSIGDTIGKASTEQVETLWNKFTQKHWIKQSAGHFHDTYNKALDHVHTSINCGVHTFDTSAGGVGGCPYAPGASGNLATEDLVVFLNDMDAQHGVDLEKLVKASRYLETILDHDLPSKAYQKHLLVAQA
jgi:hydroxymethylglutaryl-CoA lyase